MNTLFANHVSHLQGGACFLANSCTAKKDSSNHLLNTCFMGSQPKNLILLVLIYLSGQCSAQNVQGQFSSLHDSLRHNLTYFFESVKDEKIRGVIKDVQALYTSDSINDSLSRKLIVAEELLAKNSGLNRERIISCAKTISFLLAELPPGANIPTMLSA